MVDITIAGVCGAIITFPILKRYSRKYPSRVDKNEKLAICSVIAILILLSVKNIYAVEYLVVALECVLYSMFLRRDYRAIHERKELKRIIKAYGRYMDNNWYKPIKRGKIDKNDREKYSELNTFDEFFEKEYREFDSKK